MIPKSTRKLIQACKLVCAILLVLTVAAQFLPYWYGEYTETKSALMTEEEYKAEVERRAKLATETAPTTETTAVTEPETNPDGSTKPTLNIDFYTPPSENENLSTLTTYSIARYVWGFNMNHTNAIIYGPVLALIFAVASILMYVKNTYNFLCSIFGVVSPITGLMGLLTVEFYKTGAFPYVYTVNVILNAITLVVFVVTLIIQLIALIKLIKKERAEKRAKSSFANM